MTVGRYSMSALARFALAAAIVWNASAPAAVSAANAPISLRYDIQIAWIQAGEIVMSLSEHDDRYALSGTVATSRLMERFFFWHGRFVSTGRYQDGFPHTDAYMLWGRDDDGSETLHSFGGQTTIRSPGRSQRVIEQPPGSDFMSVTFLGPHCMAETTLHDGKRVYRLRLVRSVEGEVLERHPPHYAGPARRCDYRFRYPSGTTRRLSLWIAPWQGHDLLVRLRVRIPLLPDANLHLRVEELDAPQMERKYLNL